MPDKNLRQNPDTVTRETETLYFGAPDGQTMSIDSDQLGAWLARGQGKESSLEQIQLFGFKNQVDMIKFLKSDTGEKLQSQESFNKLLREIILSEKQQASLTEEQARQQSMKAMYLLGCMRREEADERQNLNQVINAQMQERLRGLDKNPERERRLREELLQRSDNYYSGAVSAIETTIAEKSQQLEDWDKEAETLIDAGEELESRYENYNTTIDFSGSINELDVDKIDEEIDSQKKVYDNLAKLSQFAMNTGDLEALRTHVTKQNAAYLRLMVLEDLKDVKENKKRLVDEDGEDTTSIEKAAFVLKPDQRIEKKGDNYYLLGRDEKLTAENEKAAAKRFDKAKNELCSIKNLVSQSSEQQKDLHKNRVDRSLVKGQGLRSEIDHLNSQLSQVKSAQAVARAELNKASPDPKKLENAYEVRTTAPSAPKVSAGDKNLSLARDASRKLFSVPNNIPSQADIDSFKSSLTNIYGATSANSFARGLRAGMPIPPLVRQRIEARMGLEAKSVELNKKLAESKFDQLSAKQEQRPQEEVQKKATYEKQGPKG